MHETLESAQTTSSKPYTIFTPTQRAFIVIIVCFAATLSAFASNIYFPALPQVATELSVSVTLVNVTVTCYLIFQGLSPTLWGSLSDTKGRRITYCCTLLIFLGACIGLAETRSYAQLLVLRCVQSTGSASTIALGAGVIKDITAREQLGSRMGYFQGGLLMPVAIGPVIGGVLSDKLGWRSVFWFLTIYGGVCLAIIALVLPETLRSIVDDGSKETPPYARSILNIYQRNRHPEVAAPPDAPDDVPSPGNSIDFLAPIKVLFNLKTFCAILYVAVHYAVWQMVLTALSTLVQNIYHISEIQIGLIFLANGAGSMIGTVLTGRFLDYDYKKVLREHGGDESIIPLEKARLRTVWIWSICEFASVVVFGWTVQKSVHISVPIVSLFVLGWAAISLQSIVSTYLVDVHHERSASAMAALNLVRCLLGAGGTAVVGPLIDAIRAGWTFTLLAGVMLIIGALVLLLIFFGKEGGRILEADTTADVERQADK